MKEKKKIVSNSDNEWPFDCVSVDEVNGPGAEEIQGFTPIRDELIQLVKFWAKKEIALDYFHFLDAQYTSDHCRLRSFASRRLGRIAKILGEVDVMNLFNEALEKFRKDRNINDRYWVETDLPDQVDEIREEVRREIEKQTN